MLDELESKEILISPELAPNVLIFIKLSKFIIMSAGSVIILVLSLTVDMHPLPSYAIIAYSPAHRLLRVLLFNVVSG